MAPYRYREAVLNELARHGVVPKATTAPVAARSVVNGLYRYELRRLRARLLRSEFPKTEYLGRVVEIRKRYPIMSLPVRFWTVDVTGEADEEGGEMSE